MIVNMLVFVGGAMVGGTVGVIFMGLLQINRERDRHS